MGRSNIDFSDQPSSLALLLKIVGNTLILSMIEALAQGHTLAEKSGLGSENLHQFIEALFPGPHVAYSNRLMSGDYYKKDPVKSLAFPYSDFAYFPPFKHRSDSGGSSACLRG